MAPKRVFISYAWESDEYRRWVESLAHRLLRSGVDVRLDEWHLQGQNIPAFMNAEVGMADKVLVLCSPQYHHKVENGVEEGRPVPGSLWEWQLVMDAAFTRGKHSKGIPVLTIGPWEQAAPTFLQARGRIDLTGQKTFEEQYRKLVFRITETTEPLSPMAPPVVPEPLPPPVTAPFGRMAEPRLHFALHPQAEGGGRIELRQDDGEPRETPLAPKLLSDQWSDLRKDELRAIREGDCQRHQLESVGTYLWTLLQGDLGETVGDALQRRTNSATILQVRLAIPPELEDLPWEALHDDRQGSLATSQSITLVRTLHGVDPEPLPRGREGPIRLLVVIPTGSGLETGREWQMLQQSVSAAGEQVQLKCLDGRVTVDRFAGELHKGWDIVHFIGHGEVDEDGQVRLRFNSREGTDADGEVGADWFPADVFAQEFQNSAVRLVVLNCCHGGAVHTHGDPTAGRGPQDLGSLGGSLLKMGRIPAVVVMRYALADAAAAEFSSAFYQALLGSQAGRVDLAMQWARAALRRNFRDRQRTRSYITPALYLAPGCEQLLEIEKQEPRPSSSTVHPVPPDPGQMKRLAPLTKAMAKRRCLLILGPGILGAAAQRDTPPPPSPQNLTQMLGERARFPDWDRISGLLESSADWLVPVLLERVCQYFVSESGGDKGDLIEAIEKAYRDLETTEEIQAIAAWQVLGIVYTHVDGLLESVLRDSPGHRLRVVTPDSLTADTSPASEDLALLNLRGNCKTGSRLVLTDQDRDRVLDHMPRIASFVADLMNHARHGGCNLIYLGVSPRDPLVRALSRRLLREGGTVNRGTAYFVAPPHSRRTDRAYWDFPNLEWLEADLLTVIQSLSAAEEVTDDH